MWLLHALRASHVVAASSVPWPKLTVTCGEGETDHVYTELFGDQFTCIWTQEAHIWDIGASALTEVFSVGSPEQYMMQHSVYVSDDIKVFLKNEVPEFGFLNSYNFTMDFYDGSNVLIHSENLGNRLVSDYNDVSAFARNGNSLAIFDNGTLSIMDLTSYLVVEMNFPENYFSSGSPVICGCPLSSCRCNELYWFGDNLIVRAGGHLTFLHNGSFVKQSNYTGSLNVDYDGDFLVIAEGSTWFTADVNFEPVEGGLNTLSAGILGVGIDNDTVCVLSDVIPCSEVTEFNSSGTFNVEINGLDSFGDGWNGGYLEIFLNGTSWSNFTVGDGESENSTNFIVTDSELEIIWNARDYPEEVSFELFVDSSPVWIFPCEDVPTALFVYQKDGTSLWNVTIPDAQDVDVSDDRIVVGHRGSIKATVFSKSGFLGDSTPSIPSSDTSNTSDTSEESQDLVRTILTYVSILFIVCLISALVLIGISVRHKSVVNFPGRSVKEQRSLLVRFK